MEITDQFMTPLKTTAEAVKPADPPDGEYVNGRKAEPFEVDVIAAARLAEREVGAAMVAGVRGGKS